MNYKISEQTLTGIANAIREKTGTTDTIKPIDMANKISTIEAGNNIMTLIHEGEYDIQYESTSAGTVVSNLPVDLQKYHSLLITIVDVNEPKNNSFYSIDEFAYIESSKSLRCVAVSKYINNDGVLTTAIVLNGLWLGLSSNGSINIYARINTQNAPSINSTYHIRVYGIKF